MEGTNEISEILRRASLASAKKSEANGMSTDEKIKELNKGPLPEDRFYFVYILFLLLGLLQFLPASFFVTANDYWMYKFRNTSEPTWDSKHRNTLQTFFASWASLVTSIPSVFCVLASTFYVHKVRARTRLLATLLPIASFFTTFTVFVKVNTDAWQTGFFVLTMTVLVLIQGMMGMFETSSLVFLSKFPRKYVFPFLFGEGMAGIFNATLEVISLSIGSSSETAGIIYFVAGTLAIWFTLFLVYFSKYSGLYKYYMDNDVEDSKRPVYKWSEIKTVSRKVWPGLTILCVNLMTTQSTHPAITSLVVSENYGKGSTWSDTYFVPVVTFLFSEVCSLIGRTSARIIIKPSTKVLWVALAFIRLLVFVPLIWFSNALPRNHLPVVFDKDWEYILTIAAYAFTNGYFFNLVFISVPTLAPGNEELAYLTMLTIVSIFGIICSPLSLLSVHII